MTPCKACGRKAAQYPRALCRRCDIAAGTYTPVVSQPTTCRRCGVETRESLCARCWQALAAEIAASARPTPAALAGEAGIVTVRERVIRGRAYVVVWDGTK